LLARVIRLSFERGTTSAADPGRQRVEKNASHALVKCRIVSYDAYERLSLVEQMRIPRRGRDQPRQPPDDFVAAEDADRYAAEAVPRLERAISANWYERPGNDADVAAFTLCRLRRARSGLRGGPEHGDEAVRAALEEAGPEAAVWIASRAISYMDENGFPEAVEPWIQEDEPAG
jgi:hypothetical protein